MVGRIMTSQRYPVLILGNCDYVTLPCKGNVNNFKDLDIEIVSWIRQVDPTNHMSLKKELYV
jgi:hypothetical protein